MTTKTLHFTKSYLKTTALALILLTAFNCSSNDDNSETSNLNQQNKECKIAKITYGFSSGNRIYTATYTGNNIAQLTSNVDKVVFTYNSNNQLIKKEIYNLSNNQIIFKSEFTPNSNGQIIEQRNWDLYNGNLTYTGKETYQYSGNRLIEILDYNVNNTTIDDKTVLEWTGENPTKLKLYDENNTLECETAIFYDLVTENKFNSTFKYFMFQDIFDEDFNTYLFLGKNNVKSTTNSCSTNTLNYNISNTLENLTNEIKQGNNSLYKFEYSCQ